MKSKIVVFAIFLTIIFSTQFVSAIDISKNRDISTTIGSSDEELVIDCGEVFVDSNDTDNFFQPSLNNGDDAPFLNIKLNGSEFIIKQKKPFSITH